MGTPLSAKLRQPGFFWQGLLILLPVLALAGLGIFSLRHDRVLAEHEAGKSASVIAEALASKLWSEVAVTNLPPQKGISFLVSTNSQLISPAPCLLTPSPVAFDVSILQPHQAELWANAQALENRDQDRTMAIKTYHGFLASEPPHPFAAAAHYALGVLLEANGQMRDAVAEFQSVAEKSPDAFGPTGLPLQPLAELKLLEVNAKTNDVPPARQVAEVDLLCSNVVTRPGPLTPAILERAAALPLSAPARATLDAWEKNWEGDQTARETYSIVAATGVLTNEAPSNGGVWCAGAVNWLVLHVPTSTGTWYACRSEKDISTALTELVKREKQLPDYFGVGIDVAGKRLTWPAPDLRMWDWVNYFGRAGGGQKKDYSLQNATNVLASAHLGPGGLLKTTVYLRSAGALYAREKARVFWFAALIASAAIAAAVGFFSAYKAFQRQLRLSELKSDFVSSVSHELRAPIASVRLMAESLEQGKITDLVKQREYFSFIRQECRRLSALVENVLDFSRIEQGRKQYEFEPTDLVALATHTVHLMQTYADEKNVHLELRLPQPNSWAGNGQPLLDGKAIQQALVNLIDNAVKHSPKNETVLIGLSRERRTDCDPAEQSSPSSATESHDQVLLWVEDHGAGIPAGEHDKIFERFYRLGSELRRETQGVGIGLSIVKHVVEAHGGRVLVRSEVGQGSRFTVELPIQHSDQPGGDFA